jgi:UDP-N-acetylmuramoylalanine--D-glutamate ligase
MKAVVLGSGISGKAAAESLAALGFSVESVDSADIVVASPGIKVISELQYGVTLLKERGVKLLAITGSKGKSSIVKLIADAINLSGKKAVPCGNYGLAVSSVGECDWAVVEVSSYQLETTNLPADTFEASAILNLQEDHLKRHGSVEMYHAVKRKILGMAKAALDCSVYENYDDISKFVQNSYFDNEILKRNAYAAVWMLKKIGLDENVIREAFLRFKPLEHRMEKVGEFKGVKYIDDSKSTSLDSLAAALQMTQGPVRLIAGGQAKGDDPKKLLRYLTKQVKKVYLIGECAELFFESWKCVVDCEISITLSEAIKRVSCESISGETVLFSPGAASFDQFKNFSERGTVFAELVKKEGQKTNE